MSLANIQESKRKPPIWRTALRNSMSKVRLRELSKLENPLTAEEQTPELIAIYHKLKKLTSDASCSNLDSQVTKLAEKEGEKQSEPYSQIVSPPRDSLQYSLKEIARDLELEPEVALEHLAPEAESLLPKGISLSQDTLFTNEDILKVQKVLVQKILQTLPSAGKSRYSPSYVITGAERDTPTPLMEYNSLETLFKKREQEVKKLQERREIVEARYQQELKRVTAEKPPVKVFSPWAEKYQKMKALISQRQGEIRDCYNLKKEKWDARLIDGWEKRYAARQRLITSKPYLSLLIQVPILFLCMCIFALGWQSFGMSDSIQLHALNTLRFWMHIPDCVQGLFNGKITVLLLVAMAVEALVCRGLFYLRFTYSSICSTTICLIVTFAFTDLLIQPMLFSALFSQQNTFELCCILQAPLATLLQGIIWKMAGADDKSRSVEKSRARTYDSRSSSGRYPQNRSKVKQMLEYGPDSSIIDQTLALFLCMFAFSLCWWPYGMYGSIPQRALNMLRFLINIPDCLSIMFSEHDVVPFLIVIALEAWGCRAFFCGHFPDCNMYATIFWLFVTFFLTDLLIQPLLYTFIIPKHSFIHCTLLQAPLATLFHMGVWSVREKKEVKSSRR